MTLPNRGPSPLSVACSGDLPATADIVVIGGGIIGAATALDLARAGHATCLLEKGIIAGEQSSRNWGWVRQAGRDLRELPLSSLARRRWQTLSERIGPDLGYVECGIAYVARSPEQAARHQAWVTEAAGHGIAAETIGPERLTAIAPGLARTGLSALYLPGDGRAEPQNAAPLLAREAIREGASIHQHCAALEIEIDRAGISGVRTERGRIATRCVIVAGGIWSAPLLRRLCVDLPQLKVLSSACRTASLTKAQGAAFTPCLSLGGVALRHRADGGVTMASSATAVAELVPDSFRHMRAFLPGLRSMLPGLKLRLGAATLREAGWLFSGVALERSLTRHRIMDPAPDRRALRQVRRRLAESFPALADLEEVQDWGGLIDVTPDVIPVISTVEPVPGLVIGTGFSGHGFGIGPGAGRVLAELATDQRPSVDLQDFRLDRFGKGQRVQMQSWL
ncbi:NAD(P)/FAD-dependent oxidoreductase [Mameliella alba]|uniref:D-amino acid oxidase n=1 Tax=Mameliella alba TaxID=561184 RepID=A0A0B3S2G4_9RHOB|nr:FAD-binding oxidoreductase [Mameliella alba]KHQ50891.1 D-amino acid oxidase [Mameliella alba]